MTDDGLKKSVARDVAALNKKGKKIALVHGGGPDIDAMLKTAGIEKRFVNGLRYTDSQTMRIVSMVLRGKINGEICALINKNGARAIGLCGFSAGLLKGRRIKGSLGEDLGLVGEVEEVGVQFLLSLINLPPQPYALIPVIAPVAFCEAEEELALNVNADYAAAKIAGALSSPSFILMTNVPGIMLDVKKPETLIREIHIKELDELQKNKVISGGMIPKIDCCRLAIKEGVKKVQIINACVEGALRRVVEEDEPLGTIVLP